MVYGELDILVYLQWSILQKKKKKCVGYDVDKKKVRSINSGVIPLKDLEKWFGFDIKKLVKKNYIKATLDFKDLISKEFIAHFIAVPTEKNGKPYYKPLMKVLDNISKIKNSKNSIPPLIIVESTLAPKVSDKKILPFLKRKNFEIGKDILFSVAPRRDWFIEGNKNLENLDRVYGCLLYTSPSPRD